MIVLKQIILKNHNKITRSKFLWIIFRIMILLHWQDQKKNIDEEISVFSIIFWDNQKKKETINMI
jgi:hypothetical protein